MCAWGEEQRTPDFDIAKGFGKVPSGGGGMCANDGRAVLLQNDNAGYITA
jgi:hypothetical protein